jgi:HEAT repeat protein
MLLARGARMSGADLPLNTLVALTSDPDTEVQRAAQQTLDQLSDQDCARLLADVATESSVLHYFLHPTRVRPALLPILLSHPSVPVDAVTALAAQAPSELIPALLEHVEHFKTPTLMALKQNPAYLHSQRKSALGDSALSAFAAAQQLSAADLAAAQQQLAGLIALASDDSEAVRRGAQETLRGLPDQECHALLLAPFLDPSIPRFFLQPDHCRPALLPALLSHPDTPSEVVTHLAARAGPDLVPVLLDNLDLLKTPALVALKANDTYMLWQKQPPQEGYVLEVDLLELLIQEMESEHPLSEQEVEAALAEVESPLPGEEKGIIRKLAKMNVAQRVKLALLGTREERAILIRDPSKVVFRAVLSSPKLTEMEIESFAALKNVSQDVLRLISMNRKFMKNYTVTRNLAGNPRVPIDVSLPLLKHLLPNDLRSIAVSRDVPDTVRKMAQKLIKTRSPQS